MNSSADTVLLRTLVAALAALLAAACSGSTPITTFDAGAIEAEDGGADEDAGTTDTDAGVSADGGARADAGATSDGGVPRVDGGRADAGPSPDAGVVRDAGVEDAGPPLVPDGGCPPPAVIGTRDVPVGYLPARGAYLGRPIDGDTATFQLQGDGGGVYTVRFLFVNTEESHGDATTAFGVETGDVVADYLREARQLQVVAREHRTRPGQPALDPYDRWLGLVFVNGELFQTRIVREGLSAYYTDFGCAPEPIHTALLYAEAEARQHRRGIWAIGHPTDYRAVLARWIGSDTCRPNPYVTTRCR